MEHKLKVQFISKESFRFTKFRKSQKILISTCELYKGGHSSYNFPQYETYVVCFGLIFSSDFSPFFLYFSVFLIVFFRMEIFFVLLTNSPNDDKVRVLPIEQ